MNVLVILAHPKPGSLNHAIAEAVVQTLKQNRHQVMFHDLYAEGFDPVLTKAEIPAEASLDPVIQAHVDDLSTADGIVVVHPNWWGQPPAMLKGWVDRVIRPDMAYKFLEGDGGEGVPKGLLKAEIALVFNTSNTPKTREREVFGDPLERIWQDCIFKFCGVREFYRRMFSIVCISTEHERKAWLSEVRETVDKYFPG